MVLNLQHTDELSLTYAGGCVARAGRMRRVPLAARKVEICAVRFPVPKNRVKTAPRENFASCGEATTFQGSYTGVTFRSSQEIPLVNVAEKGKMLQGLGVASAAPSADAAPEDWQERHGPDEQPLFWQESKPISLFATILDEFKIKAVFDATPGSGALMEASMTRGAVYHGLCLNKEHQQWLQNIADRTACALVTLQGSTLFSEGLAVDVKKHFPEILEELASKSADIEDPLEPDSPQA